MARWQNEDDPEYGLLPPLRWPPALRPPPRLPQLLYLDLNHWIRGVERQKPDGDSSRSARPRSWSPSGRSCDPFGPLRPAYGARPAREAALGDAVEALARRPALAAVAVDALTDQVIRSGYQYPTQHFRNGPGGVRRTVATVVDEQAGADLAAELLGHTDPKITIQHYIRRSDVVYPVTADVPDEVLGKS